MGTICGDGPATLHRELIEVMGTVVCFDVVVGQRGADDGLLVALAGARASLQRADALFSCWRPESPMSRVRRGEIALTDAPPLLAEVLSRCDTAKQLTGGWFDAAAMPGGVDPTGLVKGWAAQRALALVVAAGYGSAMVNAGGDAATSGSPPGGGPWRIGIVDPLGRAGIAAVAEVTGAIATSGSYERGEHLFDPFERRFTSRLASASVTGPDLALADALATALAVAGTPALATVAALEGYEALAITLEGEQLATDAFPFAARDTAPDGGAGGP